MVKVTESAFVKMLIAFRSPSSPVAETVHVEVDEKVAGIKDVDGAKVEIVFDPPWTKEMMSEEAVLELGLM